MLMSSNFSFAQTSEEIADAKEKQIAFDERVRSTLKENAQTIHFMENKGQLANSNVRYYFDGANGSVFIEKDRIRFVARQDTMVAEHEEGEEEHKHEEMEKVLKATHTFSIYLDGMNPNPAIRLGEQFKTNYNYFLGKILVVGQLV